MVVDQGQLIRRSSSSSVTQPIHQFHGRALSNDPALEQPMLAPAHVRNFEAPNVHWLSCYAAIRMIVFGRRIEARH